MATIAKFYLHDATSPNTGTMPSNSPAVIGGGVLGTGTEAAGASTARDATDVIGTANPDTESSITSQASSTVVQRLGHRRFVSRPLAATTFADTDGNWTWSYARSQSNTNHNSTSGAPINCIGYLWRPSGGTRVGTTVVQFAGTKLLVTGETADSVIGTWSLTQAILDGDIIVFDVFSLFQQGMATAYTDQFAYDGTTEASTTTCASFITPPAPLTLYTAAVARVPRSPGVDSGFGHFCKAHQAIRRWRHGAHGILVPDVGWA